MQKDYEELFANIPCGILQMELPFGHMCEIYRVNPRATEIMKVHLERGISSNQMNIWMKTI